MIPRIVAVGLIAAFSGALLSEMGYRGKKAFIAVVSAVMAIGLSSEIGRLLGELTSIEGFEGLSKIAKSAFKIIFCGYVFGIGADICQELGEPGISRLLTVASKVEILLISLPYIREIAGMGVRLLQ